jgi:diketogulonate reductase-like aldo/keto reductase
MQTVNIVKPQRRRFMRNSLAVAAGVLTAPIMGSSLAHAQPAVARAGAIVTRTIGKTNEVLPALGLGSFLTFDLLPGQKRDHLREVVKRYYDAGVRVLDTSPLYGTGETSVGDYLTSLGINEELFIANKIWSTGEYLADESHARRSLEQSQSRLWRSRFDLMQCHSLVNVDVVVPILQAWKKEGRIRYIGVTHHENAYHPLLANWIERGVVDFVQVNYSIFNRSAEERVLPAAANRGVGVFVNMALEKARLHKAVEGQAVPAFARDMGIENWAQYFLKWVMANPAVTCCLSATSNPEHAAENVGALRGPLPDRQMRERMVKHMETIPDFAKIAQMAWYPDKKYPGIIGRSQAEIRARAAS